MKNMNKYIICASLLALNVLCAGNLSAAPAGALSESQQKALAQSQVPFVKNEGQIQSDKIKFYAQTFNGTVFINDRAEIIYALMSQKDYLGAEDYLLPDGSFSGRSISSLIETPLAANPLKISGESPASTSVNYFMGDNPGNWKTNVQAYNTLALGEPWDNIKFHLKANANNIEKIFTVQPGGDTDSIVMMFSGAQKLQISESGELHVITNHKNIGFTAPVAFQEINGAKKYITVAFRIIDDNKYGFTVGLYDKSIPLIIDPLLSSTFLGGFGTDYARAIAIDPVNGNVFITGYCSWTLPPYNYPTQGEGALAPYDSTFNGTSPFVATLDIIIAKFNPTLTTLIASTYLGTAGNDGAFGIALDNQGNVFVCGFTGPGFPVLTDRPPVILPNGTQFTPTAFDTSYNGPSFIGASVNPNDGVVAKLSNSLSALLAATYIGGTQSGSLTADACTGIVLDQNNNVFVCGYTDSDTLTTTGGPSYLGGASSVNYNGGDDVFIAKFNNYLSGNIPGETTAFACIFLGGSGAETASGIALNSFDESDSVYVTGFSSSSNFPTTIGAYKRFAQSPDAFISQFSNDLRTLRASTLFGSDNGVETSAGITLGASLEGQPTVYITGLTTSPDCPVTANSTPYWNPYGATQPGLGSQDIFVARFTYDLSRLVNATWIGGTDTETAYGICRGNNNSIYICGTVESGDFPTTENAFSISNSGGSGDAFVSSFNSTLSILNASTFIGGAAADIAYAIKSDNTGNIIFAGITGDGLYPVWPTSGTDIAYDIQYNGSGDIFVTRFTPDLSGGFYAQAQPSPPRSESQDTSEGIIAGSSALANLDANAFRQSCFIATAIYGNSMHPNVIALRNFRNKHLLTNKLGGNIVNWYYRVSPPIAGHLKRYPLQSFAVQCALTPIVYAIRYPILLPIISGLLLALGYWLKKRTRPSRNL